MPWLAPWQRSSLGRPSLGTRTLPPSPLPWLGLPHSLRSPATIQQIPQSLEQVMLTPRSQALPHRGDLQENILTLARMESSGLASEEMRGYVDRAAPGEAQGVFRD